MTSLPILLSMFLVAPSVSPGSVLAASSAAIVAGPAAGTEEPSGPPPEAVDAFFEGQELFAAAKYEEALAAFQKADRLYPAPDLQYNIGLCHVRLENWAAAINAFEIYLRTKENPPDRADVEARIADARRRLEEEEEAKKSQTSTPIPQPGPTAQPGGSTPRVEDTPPPGKPYRGLVVSGGVLIGLGAAGAIGGASGLGFVINQKNDELDEVVNQGNPRDVTYAEAMQIEDDARRLRTFQFVAIGVGSATAVAGAVLLGIGLKRRSEARSGTTMLRPWTNPTGGGLTLRGTF